jgi:peptidoglycan-N-acetylglucosamine deacetylase
MPTFCATPTAATALPTSGRLTAVEDADIDKLAADLGYPAVTLWSGTIGDSLPETEGNLIACAQKSFTPQQIILAHANLPTVTHCYSQLNDLITSRNLQPVTLADGFA